MLDKIKTYYGDHPFAFEKRAEASINVLEHINDVLDSFSQRKKNTYPDLILDVYGLLQSLFVGIDALYDLAIGSTQYKYHVNINQNPVLRKLKFIRNDIVGHPTHRTYDDGSYGFSMIEEDKINRERMSYVTYVVSKKETKTIQSEVIFKELIDQYMVEKDKMIEELGIYLENSDEPSSCVSETFSLLKRTLLEQQQENELERLEKLFIKEQKITPDSQHRFLWRIGLIRLLYSWKEDYFKDYIVYLIKQQTSKLYEIACHIYEVKPQKIHIPVPKVLAQFYRFVRKVSQAQDYLNYLTDGDHPLFKTDIEALKRLNKSKSIDKLLSWLNEQTDQKRIYLIGQSLKSYRKK